MRRVFLTGATGTMGSETLRRLLEHGEEISVTVLARDSKRNHKKLDGYVEEGRFRVIWGDLTRYEDVRRGVEEADYVLHVGGMVSPAADHCPEMTHRVNVGGTENIVRAIKERSDGGAGCRMVYIGSVVQYGFRSSPKHWGRAGDPVWSVEFDPYGRSKVESERVVVESGIPCWVSLRQTAILAPDIVSKGSDPITFHVPLRGALEWVTAEDSGRLLCNLVLADLPERFWKHFYNIGGGEGFRLTNYEFEKMFLEALGCPPVEKVFEPNWFATRNFHGCWFEDSDILEDYLHFRGYTDAGAFFADFKKQFPWYFRLTPCLPARVIKRAMGYIAHKAPLGTMSWVRNHDGDRLRAFFGGIEGWWSIPGWDKIDLNRPSGEAERLDHGFDESVPEERIGIVECRDAAVFRGGKCLSDNMAPGALDELLEWECHDGHRFRATPRLVLLGGHWCPKCFGPDADSRRLEEVARHNRFFAQVLSDDN